MSIAVIIPQIGQSIAEATIVRWLKKPGDRVEKGEPIVEIGTDKINTELPSPESGVVERLLVDEGQTVPVDTEIALVSGESSQGRPSGSTSASTSQSRAPAAREETMIHSPLVRRLAQENNIDLASMQGTGAGGRITKDDVLAAVERRKTDAAQKSIESRRVE